MIAEAIDTAYTLGRALIALIVLTAAVGVLALYTVVAVARLAGRDVSRGVAAALALAALRNGPTGSLAPEFPASDSSPAIPTKRRSDGHTTARARKDAA